MRISAYTPVAFPLNIPAAPELAELSRDAADYAAATGEPNLARRLRTGALAAQLTSHGVV